LTKEHQLDNPWQSYGHFSMSSTAAGHHLGLLDLKTSKASALDRPTPKTHQRTKRHISILIRNWFRPMPV